ncbi:MAG: hypothetical protein WD770_03230 [Actinomycetota bacterium]
MGRDAHSIPTDPEDPGLPRARRARLVRRFGVVLLVVFVGLGASGVLGVRTTSVSASGGGYELTVTYPAVTRPGLASRWGFELTRAGGFDGPITVATTHAWLDLFDENGRNPAPSAETVDGDMLVWEFDPPEGDTLTFVFDARLGPSEQSGMTARTEVREDTAAIVSVSYTTTVMP